MNLLKNFTLMVLVCITAPVTAYAFPAQCGPKLSDLAGLAVKAKKAAEKQKKQNKENETGPYQAKVLQTVEISQYDKGDIHLWAAGSTPYLHVTERGKTRIINLVNKELVPLKISKDGNYLMRPSGQRLVSYVDNGKLSVSDLDGGKLYFSAPIKDFNLPKLKVNDFYRSPLFLHKDGSLGIVLGIGDEHSVLFNEPVPPLVVLKFSKDGKTIVDKKIYPTKDLPRWDVHVTPDGKGVYEYGLTSLFEKSDFVVYDLKARRKEVFRVRVPETGHLQELFVSSKGEFYATLIGDGDVDLIVIDGPNKKASIQKFTAPMNGDTSAFIEDVDGKVYLSSVAEKGGPVLTNLNGVKPIGRISDTELPTKVLQTQDGRTLLFSIVNKVENPTSDYPDYVPATLKIRELKAGEKYSVKLPAGLDSFLEIVELSDGRIVGLALFRDGYDSKTVKFIQLSIGV
jgi:hypothetical protein